ncbi:MAG: ABC transporter ATP-binding protein [Clostridiales bacterium]|jgi:peptide/nickel transport system ATP-binding protein|nr:ABC transporter ATP-binding protein [Clostridiales bacterium]
MADRTAGSLTKGEAAMAGRAAGAWNKSEPGAAPLLEIKGLRLWYKVYRERAKVLDGVDLTVSPGQKVGIVGEAGCGKTTTVKSILGILPRGGYEIPSGRILFDGADVLAMKGAELRKIRSGEISMIYQEPSAALNPVFTVGQQMTDVARYSARGREKGAKECREIALGAIRDVLIPDAERIFHFYPHQLSGGMKQRICIAMAIMTPRRLLIADEPGTALDVTIQSQVHELMEGLVSERGMALIMITHSLGVARELADVINIMYAGTVVESAAGAEIFARPLHPYTKGLMASVPRLGGGGIQAGIYGSLPDYLNPPTGCRFAPRCPMAGGRCLREKPELADLGGHKIACFRAGE